jgi:hypothetical protein
MQEGGGGGEGEEGGGGARQAARPDQAGPSPQSKEYAPSYGRSRKKRRLLLSGSVCVVMKVKGWDGAINYGLENTLDTRPSMCHSKNAYFCIFFLLSPADIIFHK